MLRVTNKLSKIVLQILTIPTREIPQMGKQELCRWHAQEMRGPVQRESNNKLSQVTSGTQLVYLDLQR